MGKVTELVVHWTDTAGKVREQRFSQGFSIGRSQDCELCLGHDSVSRRHATVSIGETGWWVRDMGSANGTFLNDQRVEAVPLGQRCKLRIGIEGPQLGVYQIAVVATRSTLDVTAHAEEATVVLPALPRARHEGIAFARTGLRENGTTANPAMAKSRVADDPTERASERQSAKPMTPEAIAERYFHASEDDGNAGEYTRAFRLAYRTEQGKQKRRHFSILAGVIALACVALTGSGIYLLWQQQQVEQSRRLAIDLFYDIKDLELDLARFQERISSSEDTALAAEMEANRAKLEAMSTRYDRYLEEQARARRSTNQIDQKELTILRMARLFGECELNMPDSFHAEVNTYIAKWQSSGRLKRAITRAKRKGYVEIVRDVMNAHGLPEQFFYLGLQESNFNEQAVGPPTRYGIAKGAWQFIPTTAERFGLQVGPLVEEPVYDPDDQRFDFAASADAAARYLRKIYDTDAQASGLLVMASYNWGEGNIIKRIRSMPKNPRERNFWKLVEKHDIPKETYNYVFYIFSAAVIGEKPSLFGFDFESPL